MKKKRARALIEMISEKFTETLIIPENVLKLWFLKIFQRLQDFCRYFQKIISTREGLEHAPQSSRTAIRPLRHRRLTIYRFMNLERKGRETRKKERQRIQSLIEKKGRVRRENDIQVLRAWKTKWQSG